MPDILLAFFLLVLFPLRNLWRSLRPTARPKLPPLREYWRQARFLLVLMGAFVLVAWQQGHTPQALGLGLPPSTAGLWGLLFAVCLLLGIHLAGKFNERRMTPAKRNEERAAISELPFVMPRTPLETLAFVATKLSMMAAWEILYRGYLLLVLAPHTGLALAVLLSSISYGAGHGYTSLRQFSGSIVMALAFTAAYALSGSLWWLIVLHAAAPLSMLFAVRKLNAPPAGAAPCAAECGGER